jgi:transcriptional regulator with XRE-family HTH domain
MKRPRQKPLRLAEKLLRIRTALGLSQNEMIRRLGFDGELIQAHISAYERKRENRIPPLGVVLQYARCVGVGVEVLIDDDLELPDTLPVSLEDVASSQKGKKIINRTGKLVPNKDVGSGMQIRKSKASKRR